MAVTGNKLAVGVGREVIECPLAPAISQTNAIALIQQMPYGFVLESLQAYCRALAGTVAINVGFVPVGGVLDAVTLATGTTTSRFQLSTTLLRAVAAALNANTGLPTVVNKAAEDNIQFSSAFTVNAAAATGTFFGACRVQMNAAGTISTKVVSADQTYASAAAAQAAAPPADVGQVNLGTITIQAVNVAFTANTTLLGAAGITTTYQGRASSLVLLNGGADLSYTAGRLLFATPSTAQSTRRSAVPGALLVLRYTTNGSGALTEGSFGIGVRPFPANGESTP